MTNLNLLEALFLEKTKISIDNKDKIDINVNKNNCS